MTLAAYRNLVGSSSLAIRTCAVLWAGSSMQGCSTGMSRFRTDHAAGFAVPRHPALKPTAGGF